MVRPSYPSVLTLLGIVLIVLAILIWKDLRAAGFTTESATGFLLTWMLGMVVFAWAVQAWLDPPEKRDLALVAVLVILGGIYCFLAWKFRCDPREPKE
jgi:uncharacterized membrane protein